ncbi:MAG: hypothetical protein RLZZ227_1997, partial [Pseudomonadota bacterium]
MEPDTSKLYPAAFKATVAFAALRGSQTCDELALRYSIPPRLIHEWMRVLEQRAESLFVPPPDNTSLPNSDFFDTRELAKTIAENSTQGFAMINSEGFCVYANRAWLDMSGYTSAEIGAKPLHYLVHHHRADGKPYPMEECPINRALPENFTVRGHKDLFFRKDGSTLEVSCAASPIFRDGKPVAAVIEIRDVTEQNRQAKWIFASERRAVALAESAEQEKRRLNAFLDAAPVGIVLADTEGKILLVNSAHRQLWGDNLPVAASITDYDVFKGWWADGAAHYGQQLQPEEWAMARALRGVHVDNDIVEIEPFDQPGGRRIVSLSARPICDASGVIIGSVAVQVDITQQKQAEDALRQADRNKDDFLAMLAHELRNPLAPVRTAVELLGMRQLDDPIVNKAVAVLRRQVNHMVRLIDELLDLARISRAKVELKTELFDLSRVVSKTVEDYRPTVEASGVALAFELPPTPVWMKGDKVRVAQIISNLLHNAAKFTKQGQHVHVTLREEINATRTNFAVISVKDDGIGIAADLIDTLFSPFVQASQGLDRTSGGLGLGLALVNGLTELHGGRVSAESSGEGLGATFTVYLPVSDPTELKPKTARLLLAESGLKIVAIDDNVDVLDLLSEVLRMQGHEITLAYDGTSGLEAVRDVQPDVVLCDIGLPDRLSGYDVARAIREDPKTANVMLVAISGYGQPSDKQKACLAGFNAHLV